MEVGITMPKSEAEALGDLLSEARDAIRAAVEELTATHSQVSVHGDIYGCSTCYPSESGMCAALMVAQDLERVWNITS